MQKSPLSGKVEGKQYIPKSFTKNAQNSTGLTSFTTQLFTKKKPQSFSDRRGVPPNRFFVTHKNSKVISRDIAHGLALSKVIPEMLQNSDKAQRKSRRKNNSENHHSGATNFRLFANRINQILIFKRISS